MNDFLQQASFYYLTYTELAYLQFLKYFPRFDNMNRFDKFFILNMIILFSFFILQLFKCITPITWYRTILKYVFKLSFVKANVDKQLAKMKLEITTQFPDQCKSQLKKIPYKVPDIVIGDASQKQSLKGYLSGSRYPIKSHSDFVISLAKKFSFMNPLHVELFPYVKQMQIEVIHMCSKMINLTTTKKGPIGSLNSGGTQSILLCILAYRQYKFKYQNVRNPNIIVCKTAHIAAMKAADYFGIQIRMVGYNKNFQMNISEIKNNIDQNTICVYTSYPNYPYGNIDPIPTIASYCHSKNIPVHVDMCLGGFLAPFLKSQCDEKGQFKLPLGVTSVSLDPHKYGLSPKGASISLFTDEKYRNCHMFTTMFWPGGLYGTPGFAGSRSGTPIAGAWISMMKMGQQGYRKNAEQVQQATMNLATELRKLGFNVYGQPRICCIGFDHPIYSISSIQEYMKKRNWQLSLNQKPMSFHYSFTPLNSSKVDDMIKDFKQCISMLAKQPVKKIKDTGMLELYGACSKIPDGNTKQLVMASLLDCFLDI